MDKKKLLLLFCLLIGLILTGCQSANISGVSSTSVYQETQPDEVVVVPEPTITPQNEAITLKTDEASINILESLSCENDFCQVAYTGFLQRPFTNQDVLQIDWTYPYASTLNGTLDVHHGVEFQNEYGTVVRAAAPGEVVFAGSDDTASLGSKTYFYGNVVIVRHHELFDGVDIFTLYGHLSEVDVGVGNWVSQGDPLGKVGDSGAAIGPHLHFEVRVETNDYAHTTNPALWFSPLMDENGELMSTLAGVIIDSKGTFLQEQEFTLDKLRDDGSIEDRIYLTTYNFSGTNSHPLLGENFVVTDLLAGDYRITYINNQLYEIYFTLSPGNLGFITLKLN